MDGLFREVAAHQMLGRAIEHLGQTRFWRQLLLLLNQLLPLDNALVTLIGRDGVPAVLEEYDTGGSQTPSLVPRYLEGLYLLDPFLQAVQDGLAEGFYRLEEVAPDRFRQSEYFLTYFREAVGEDELQVILRLPGEQTLSLSLGAHRRFEDDALGRLAAYAPWLIALLRQHCALRADTGAASRRDTLAGHVELALAHFGAARLTEREMAIARLVLRGHSSKAIADRLDISPETVKVHRRHLYSKLGISTQPELFSLFLQALGQNDYGA